MALAVQHGRVLASHIAHRGCPPRTFRATLPSAMLHPCAQPGCPTLVARGLSRCPDHYRRSSVRTRVGRAYVVMPAPMSHPHKPFYNSAAWRRARLAYLVSHPICEIVTSGRACSAPATEVHHRESLDARPDLALDPTNFEAGCKRCHSRETVRLDGGFGR